MVTLYIILGVLFGVATIVGLVVSLNGMVKIKKEISELKEHTEHLHRELVRNNLDVGKLVEYKTKEQEESVSSAIAILNKSIDSRIDKLEHRVTAKIPPTNADVLAELLKVREEFLTLRKNL